MYLGRFFSYLENVFIRVCFEMFFYKDELLKYKCPPPPPDFPQIGTLQHKSMH